MRAALLLLSGCASAWYDGRTWPCAAITGDEGLLQLQAPGGLDLVHQAGESLCRVDASGPDFPTIDRASGTLVAVDRASAIGVRTLEASWGTGQGIPGETTIDLVPPDGGPSIVTLRAPPSDVGTLYWDDVEDTLFLTCVRCFANIRDIGQVDLELQNGAAASVCDGTWTNLGTGFVTECP